MDTKIVLDFLSKLGEQISSNAQLIFQIYAQQAYIDGVVSLIFSGISLLIFTLCVFGIVKFGSLRKQKMKKGEYDYRSLEPTGAGLAFSWIFLVISFLFFIGMLSVGLKEIMNPEYYALQDVIRTIKG